MATVTLSKTAEAWDRRYLCYQRQSDSSRALERTPPAFGFMAWFLVLFAGRRA